MIRDEELIENARTVGSKMLAAIRDMTVDDARVAEVRGVGLFIGVDIVTDRETQMPDPVIASAMVNALRDRRVLISASGPRGNVLKVRPPMAFRASDAERFIEAFGSVF